MALNTTQTVTATSGIRNSGGIVNISGTVVIQSILIVPASGQAQAASNSGIVLAVNAATSGMVSQLSGVELFRYDGGSHSGLSTGNTGLAFAPLTQLNFLAYSGFATLNSGTHVYDIIVNYRT